MKITIALLYLLAVSLLKLLAILIPKCYFYDSNPDPVELANNDNSGDNTNCLISYDITTSNNTYYLRIIGVDGATGNYTLNISFTPSIPDNNNLPGDGNDTFETATQLALTNGSLTQNASLDTSVDNDYYSINLNPGSFTFETTGDTDTRCYFYDSSQDELASDDTSGSDNNCRISYDITSNQR